MNKVLKFSILGLFMLNIPSFILTYLNPVLSSALSYLSFGLLILFFLTNSRSEINKWLLVIGVLYFCIGSLSGQTYIPPFDVYLIEWVKYFIIVICGNEVVKRTTTKEMSIFLLIGASSIILQIFLFNNPLKDYGRYSGFFLNPNAGGFICILGYALSYSIKNRKFKFFAQWTFTLMGLLTFSRTFILLWVIINLISIKLSIKNANKLLLGAGLLFTLVAYNSFLPVKNQRLTQLAGTISGDSNAARDLNEGSRTETWAKFYEFVLDKPLFGNGSGSFGGGGLGGFLGAHNSYLKLIGEAGIIPFLLLVFYFIYLIKNGYHLFDHAPYLFFMAIALASILMTNHSFFKNGYLLFSALWIYAQINLLKRQKIIEPVNNMNARKTSLE
ncbi:O-antigen ligase family protein [Zobellia galactanivorans]|uniref:O-antigen ligase family protein n=1 Tax=Zobellia galactanivorans (strain DSM 12802 / CCUG 47099 / CIP 106680 / NCIMB 13871 / Dsij) TaxID=63186 RepID=UPI0011DC9590|nr:O-antigen ligase family protein [Zobellia galactanivorans]